MVEEGLEKYPEAPEISIEVLEKVFERAILYYIAAEFVKTGLEKIKEGMEKPLSLRAKICSANK